MVPPWIIVSARVLLKKQQQANVAKNWMKLRKRESLRNGALMLKHIRQVSKVSYDDHPRNLDIEEVTDFRHLLVNSRVPCHSKSVGLDATIVLSAT
jgi:hypothetical protein